jgi:hypothetical protein
MAGTICEDLGWGLTPDKIAQDIHATASEKGLSYAEVAGMVTCPCDLLPHSEVLGRSLLSSGVPAALIVSDDSNPLRMYRVDLHRDEVRAKDWSLRRQRPVGELLSEGHVVGLQARDIDRQRELVNTGIAPGSAIRRFHRQDPRGPGKCGPLKVRPAFQFARRLLGPSAGQRDRDVENRDEKYGCYDHDQPVSLHQLTLYALSLRSSQFRIDIYACLSYQ